MLEQLGGLFGGIVVLLYFMTILNYFVKFINRKYKNKLMKNEKFYKAFSKLMKFTIKRHKLFGTLTIAFILLHFILQFLQYGLNITGVIAATIMLIQVGLGIYGSKRKKRGKKWIVIHRTIAVVLLIAIVVHVA